MPYLLPTIGRGSAPTFVGGLGDPISIPDYSFWSSGDISAFYNVVLDRVSHLEHDIDANVPHTSDGEQLQTEYRQFKNDFLHAWGEYHNAWPSGSSATPVATAREMAGRYNAFETRYRNLSGRPPTTSSIATVQEQHEPAPRIAGLPVWAWAGLGLTGLGLLGWIMTSVRGVASEARKAAIGRALAANRRGRRRRA